MDDESTFCMQLDVLGMRRLSGVEGLYSPVLGGSGVRVVEGLEPDSPEDGLACDCEVEGLLHGAVAGCAGGLLACFLLVLFLLEPF